MECFYVEEGTIGHYKFSGNFCFKLQYLPEQYDGIWKYVRSVYAGFGHELRPKQRLVMFCPYYLKGSTFSAHQDNEHGMSADMVFSISVGENSVMGFATTKQGESVLVPVPEFVGVFFYRNLWHWGHSLVHNWRVNFNFRCGFEDPSDNQEVLRYAPLF